MIWTTDAETDPFLHGRIPQPFIWGLFTGAAFHAFKKTEDLIRELHNNDVICYAHNGGKFDFHYLINAINLREKITVINGRLVVSHIGKCELRDSWNILPVRLKDFGNKLEIDYKKLEADVRHLHMPEIIRYLKVDCVDLWQHVTEFEEVYGRHLTAASAAMDQWIKISGEKKPHTDREYFQQFSQYYFGGRVQCFMKGHVPGPIKCFDIKSAYAWAMLDEHPYGPEYITLQNPNDFSGSSMVRVSCVSKGALPYRNERGGMVFPTDDERREYYVTGHELQAGLDTGTVENVRVLEAIDFLNKVSFRQYIEHFFQEKRNAEITNNVALTIFCKLLMNGLYGKFGANPDNYGNFMCVPFPEMEDYAQAGYMFEGMIGDHALLRADLEEWQSHFINVATASSITGQVRAKMWRAICASTRPVYCDTDGLMCQDADLDMGSQIGQWKDEGTASDVWIAGKKMYLCDGIFDKEDNPKMATKGVRLLPQQIRDAAMGLEVVAKNDAPTFRLAGAPVFQTRRIRATA